jgi:hypothetical protein
VTAPRTGKQTTAMAQPQSAHDTFIAKPSRLSEDNTLPVPPPSPGTEARDIFPAQPPHVVVREVHAVEHMLLTAGHWLATVDVSSVPLHEQQGLFELAAAAFVVAGQRFPSAPGSYPCPRKPPPACCPSWRCCFTVEPTLPEKDGAAPEHRTVEPKEAVRDPQGSLGRAPQQPKRERARHCMQRSGGSVRWTP